MFTAERSTTVPEFYVCLVGYDSLDISRMMAKKKKWAPVFGKFHGIKTSAFVPQSHDTKASEDHIEQRIPMHIHMLRMIDA